MESCTPRVRRSARSHPGVPGAIQGAHEPPRDPRKHPCVPVTTQGSQDISRDPRNHPVVPGAICRLVVAPSLSAHLDWCLKSLYIPLFQAKSQGKNALFCVNNHSKVPLSLISQLSTMFFVIWCPQFDFNANGNDIGWMMGM